MVAAGKKILVGYIRRGGEQAVHIHPGRWAEQDTVRIDQPDVSVGLQLPEQLRRVVADDPVEGDGTLAGLIEFCQFTRVDAETVPVDDSPVAGLVHDRDTRHLADTGLTADDDTAIGIGQGLCHGERQWE